MQKLKYISAIDGLRALAVLAVLFYHLDMPLFKGGFMGVDIFFVLSGFLITRIIHTELLAGEFSFARFYARRVRRIFPALFVMMFVASVAAILFLLPTEYRDFMRGLRHAALQFSNLLFSERIDYFQNAEAENPLLHTWSLGVEEQFYFVWPLLFWLVARFWQLKKVAWVLVPLSILSFMGSLWVLKIDPNKAFYLLPPRAWELAVGGMVALASTKLLQKKWLAEALGVAGVALMVWAILGFDNTNFPGVKALLPVAGAALAIYAFQAPHTTRVMQFFALKPIVFVGLISYSLYLWHWRLITFYKNYTLQPLTWSMQAAIIVASFVLAVLSWRFVERPFRGHKAINYKKTFGVAFVVMLSFVLVSNGLKTSYQKSWRYLGEFDKNIFASNFDAEDCAYLKAQNKKGWCMRDPEADAYDVLLVGDSHTWHYESAVSAWAKSKGYKVRFVTHAGCPTFFLPRLSDLQEFQELAKKCMPSQKEFPKALQHKSLKYVFLGMRLDGYWLDGYLKNKADQDFFVESFYKGVKHTKSSVPATTKIVFLGQVPISQDSATQCRLREKLLGSVLFEKAPCPAFDVAYSEQRLGYISARVKTLIAQEKGYYFDPRPYLNNFEDDQGHSLYRDNNHLNGYGAELLVEPLKAFMDK